jgi:hypothetical protein
MFTCQESDVHAKLTPRLRQYMAHLGPEEPVTVSVRLKPISLEGRPAPLTPTEVRTWLACQREDALAHVVSWLNRERGRRPTVRVWRQVRANQIGVEAPRHVVKRLADLDSIKEIALLEEDDDALRF